MSLEPLVPDRSELDNATLMEALEKLSDGIAIFDEIGRPIYINPVSQRRFGAMFEALNRGESYKDGTRPLVKASMPHASEAEIETIVDQLYDFYANCGSYQVKTDEGRMALVTYREMSNNRKVAISVDIHDMVNRERELKHARKEAEVARKQAEAANVSKSAFLANMSHEIRTPLNGILGMAQVLAMGDARPDQQEQIATIIESGKTLMALLNDVLDLSKIEAGKFDIVPSDANVQEVLRNQLKLWRPRAEEKGLELSLSFDADLPSSLSFDAVRVQQCLSNLLSNAIKFTKEGRVDILASAKALDGGACLVEIRVRDTGPGMDAETLGRLFKPFAQADETIQRAHGGTGLGLSITRRLAELMGGSATAASEPGRGSTFRITFRGEPAATQAPPCPAGDCESPGGIRERLKQSNLRVLLVDDHPINRQVAKLFLRPFNMRVVEAVNGLEALELLARDAFDLVLLDMHMPVMDGPTAIRRIRESKAPWSAIPVIALTADAMSGDRERYLSLGMNGYLSKPLAERELLSEIARVRTGGAGSPTASAPPLRAKSA